MKLFEKIKDLVYAVLNYFKGINMAKFVETLKEFAWILMVAFTISGFVQTLLTLDPRMSKIETRISSVETRQTKLETKVSNIEIKLDAILDQSRETQKDVKDIYRVLIER